MTVFFGFALADSMFSGDGEIVRRELGVEEVIERQHEFIPCINPSHEATIAAMRARFGIDIAIPATPPKVVLGVGDAVIVMGVRGLPRLTDRHEYTPAEIAGATFSFTSYIFWGKK